MSREKGIKSCVNCYELSRRIIAMDPNDEMNLKGSISLITLYNNALDAAAKAGPKGKLAAKLCVDCNFTEPKIANFLRKR